MAFRTSRAPWHARIWALRFKVIWPYIIPPFCEDPSRTVDEPFLLRPRQRGGTRRLVLWCHHVYFLSANKPLPPGERSPRCNTCNRLTNFYFEKSVGCVHSWLCVGTNVSQDTNTNCLSHRGKHANKTAVKNLITDDLSCCLWFLFDLKFLFLFCCNVKWTKSFFFAPGTTFVPCDINRIISSNKPLAYSRITH